MKKTPLILKQFSQKGKAMRNLKVCSCRISASAESDFYIHSKIAQSEVAATGSTQVINLMPICCSKLKSCMGLSELRNI